MIEDSPLLLLEAVGYGLAAAAFLVLTALIVYSDTNRRHMLTFAGASAATVVWAAALSGDAVIPLLSTVQVVFLEFSVDALWLIFLSVVIGSAGAGSQFRIVRLVGIVIAAGLLILGTGLEVAFRFGLSTLGAESIFVIGSLFTSLAALVLLEQIYRNDTGAQRDGVKFLCLGVGAMFVFDLFLYSNAILVGEIGEIFWSARGYVVAISAPMIAIAVRRLSNWSSGIFVSRQIIFHTTTVIVSGVYLTLIGIAGYYVRMSSSVWGPVAQVVLFSVALVFLFAVLTSTVRRHYLRVFINKHFYRNKYDYREQWLRLSDTLTSNIETTALKERAVQALAQIVDSPSGVLWMLCADESEFRIASYWNSPTQRQSFKVDESLPEFMRRSKWVVEVSEYLADPDRYKMLDLDVKSLGVEDAALVIPLFSSRELIGFVVLSKPSVVTELNFEDRDLLKTAAKQIASFLMLDRATEMLAQSRQFEAFNKLTAYIMHDLKNIIAQHSLVVQNAKLHKDNPLFFEDAIATIDGGVARMNRVIEQLRERVSDPKLEKVELGAIVLKAVSQCSDRKPIPTCSIGDERIVVRADPDRLQAAIFHALRNAQDATDSDGEISVRLSADSESCRIFVTDSGCGMDESFIQDRLFKPFDSTKGTQGMGIGAYQVRETLRSMDATIEVESAVGRGTTVIMNVRKV